MGSTSQSSTRSIGIVWNPSKTDQHSLTEALEEALDAPGSPEAHQLDVSWYETTEHDAGQGATSAALAAGIDTIVAAGGDGTIRAVIEQLAATPEASRVPLGIVPMGTGNLLARNLDLPLDDVSSAFVRALGEHSTPIDVATLTIELPAGTEQHTFAVMAGFGLDANMIVETDDDLKEKVGWLAYVESLGRALSASESVEAEVTFDGGESKSLTLHTLMVGNCGTLQGGLLLLPDADPSDGELDALLLSAEGLPGWLNTFRNMVWDNGLRRFFAQTDELHSNEDTEHRRLRTLDIQLTSPRDFQVDGDHLGVSDRARITVQPRVITVQV